MKDSTEQTDAQPAYASQPSALRERLLRLLTAPVGVVDVRYAQQKYARIAEWLDKRAALLQHLHARYGVAEGFADDDRPLVHQEPPGWGVNFHSTTVQAFSTVQSFPTVPPPFGEQSAMRSATPEASAQPFSPAELTQTYADSATTTDSTVETPLTYTPRRAADPSQLREGEFRVSRRRAQFNSSPVPSATPDHGLPLADTRARTVDTRARTEVAATTPRGPESVAARGAEAPEPNTSAASSSDAARAVAREVVQTESTRTAPHASPSTLPLAYARPAVLTAGAREEVELSGRQPTSPRPTGRQPNAGTAAAANEGEPVLAAEIRDASFTQARPEIVWRASPTDAPAPAADAYGQGRGGGDGPASNARQIDGRTVEREGQPSPQIDTPAKRREQGSEIRIEQISPRVIHTISEKVMRAISHDLNIELERRGLRKWR